MFKLSVLVALLVAPVLSVGDVVLYPTLPGSYIRDYSKPGIVVQESLAYPTRPGSNIRDYSQPSYVVQPSEPMVPKVYQAPTLIVPTPKW